MRKCLTKISHNLQYNNHATHNYTHCRNMSYTRWYKYRGDAKQYAPDNSGKHPTASEHTCKDLACSTKKCQQPCESDGFIKCRGHLTHNPPANKESTF